MAGNVDKPSETAETTEAGKLSVPQDLCSCDQEHVKTAQLPAVPGSQATSLPQIVELLDAVVSIMRGQGALPHETDPYDNAIAYLNWLHESLTRQLGAINSPSRRQCGLAKAN